MNKQKKGMFSGLMTSVALCRQYKYSDPQREVKGPMDPPKRFTRRVGRHLNDQAAYVSTDPAQHEKDYKEAAQAGGETVRQGNTHRYKPLLPGDGQDGVITPWSPGGGVDEEVDGLVRDWDRRRLREHDVQVDAPKDLLQGVEREPTQFAFDEIWAVLHDGLELHVSVPALPPGDQVEHVRALSCPPVLSAGCAGQSDAESGEEWEICGLVPHPEEPREEVDLAGHRGNSQ